MGKDAVKPQADAAAEAGETGAVAPEVKPKGVDIAAGHLEDMLSHRTHNTNLPAFTKADIEKYIKKSCPGISYEFEIEPIEFPPLEEGGKPVMKNGMLIHLKEFNDTAIVPKSGPYMFGDF